MASESSDSFSLGLDEPPQPLQAQPYRVLARKYRPQNFDELIGQAAMVQTLGNAIQRGRLAHAFILTGVRGVGKTSTARLIAKALNCIGPDGQGGPTIAPCAVCEPCRAIAEGRHIDVIEMDAASHTGVDDVREIIEAVRYAAVAARYKVYIVDEVHMLSKNAFNALLKTLEEPPPHVKFLFATTEVNKVPVTVLSRCQRFDLRRISTEQLTNHFGSVCVRECVAAEPEALALIARAAEGSARDGLSILDQAIAHGEGGVTAAQVRAMLGLSDRGAVRELLGRLLSGDAPAVLSMVREQYDLGVEPGALLRGLLEAVHGITRAKVGGAPDAAQSAEERDSYADWSSRLSHALVHRLWQLLLKGLGEVQSAALPIEAAEMALLRVIHASDLPDPSSLAEQIIAGGQPRSEPAQPRPAPPASGGRAQLPSTYLAMIEALEQGGQHGLGHRLRDHGRLIAYDPPRLVLQASPRIELRELGAALKAVTGTAWAVEASETETASPTLLEQEREAAERLRQDVLASPMVSAALAAFPGAELARFTHHDQRSA